MAKAAGTPDPDALPELERTTVTLPWEAFKKLLELPPKDEEEGKPPTPFVVKRAAYQGAVSGDHADLTATFEVEVFADGWVNAPLLPVEGVALKAARVNKKDVALSVHEDHYGLAIQGKGTYGVALDFQVALTDPDAQSGLSLNLVKVPVSLLELAVPVGGVEVSVEPAYGLQLDANKKSTRISAALGPAQSVSVDWREKDEAPEVKVMPLPSADWAISASFADRLLTLQARVTLSIQKAPIGSVAVLLPEGVNFLAAEGDVVRDWEPEGKASEPGGRRARIHFQYDVQGDHTLTLRAELPLGEGEQVSVPPLLLAWDKAVHQAEVDGKAAPKVKPAPELLERQKGVIALSAEPRTELKLGRTQNLVPLDVKELPRTVPASAHPPLFALRFARVPYQLGAVVVTHEDVPVLVATIDHAHLEAIALEDGRTLCKALLNVRNNSRQFLKVRLPPGAQLWSSFRSNRPVKPAADAEGLVRVPLVKSGESAPFTVELAWLIQAPAYGGGGARELVLPRFDLPASFYSLQLYLPKRYRHYNFDGALKRVEALSRSFSYLASAVDMAPMANVMSQSVAQAPAVEGGAEAGSAGQLPIRIPMLRRGLEARFERTLVVDEPLSLRWECKRRKSDGF